MKIVTLQLENKDDSWYDLIENTDLVRELTFELRFTIYFYKVTRVT